MESPTFLNSILNARMRGAHDFPEELLVEILSWVEVKALMRFRCVSKCWNSRIFDPSFIKLHLQRSSKDSHILITFDDDEKTTTSLAPCSIRRLLETPSSTIRNASHHQFFKEDVVDVCNGLVCFHGRALLFGPYNKDAKHWFKFWNPATRFGSGNSPLLRVNIDTNFGFGYDDLSDKYKVVALISYKKSKSSEVKVHCLGETCWRTVLIFSTPHVLLCKSWHIYGKFMNGTVNWLVCSRSCHGRKHFSNNQLLIFSYDLRNNTYRYFLPPNDFGVVHTEYYVKLGVLKGFLCLNHNLNDTNLVVWRMSSFGDEKSWTQILNVLFENLTFIPLSPSPLYVSESGDFIMLENSNRTALIVYNRRQNKANRVKLHGVSVEHEAYGYCQSLVLPYPN